ncbi:MAG: endonuclease/exonuclease/phosphatase family protein [Ilumatobacter sp.]|uniref:endonuclease/exonuclease/phosphatase family protein n=1 Tax=Ilumatobacter sp. TaxID=1967498 RepID=UPI00262D5505|nr:endonuclease/exonuclease/phosphatase family protein [Ilumatobacter sp.]MDJ0767821.1 endonuclease/exonuclease/phosphatase family protein [Ilumatobacter sp.]
MRVATWNVWWRNGDWEARQPAILQALRDIDADIVGLQEMSSRDPDQPAWLREELGYHLVASPDADEDEHALVNAIASRWPIVDAVWHYLDVGDMKPHRTVLRATIDMQGTVLQVYCTHLSHGFDQSDLRRRQLDQIAGMVAAERGDPATSFPPIVLGDLNAVPESDEIRRMTGLSAPAADGLVFTDAWAQIGNGDGATYSAHNPYVVDSAWPERRLDYVLVGWPRPRPQGNPVRGRLFGVGPVRGVVASDHYGVVVELQGPA